MKRLILPLALGTVLSGAIVAFATETSSFQHHRAINHWSRINFVDPSVTPTGSAKADARRSGAEG